MTKTKAQNAATLTAGSAERTIEDRAGARTETEGASRNLAQPEPADDAKAMSTIFSAIADLGTFETEYHDEHGELCIANQRGFALKMLARGVVGQLDYVIGKQNERCKNAERSLGRAKNDRRAEVDESHVAKLENWVERETDKLLDLIAMREAAGTEYEALIGEEYIDYRNQPKAPPVSAASKRREEAMKRYQGA